MDFTFDRWNQIKHVKEALICLDAENWWSLIWVEWVCLDFIVDMVKITDLFLAYNKGLNQLEQ